MVAVAEDISGLTSHGCYGRWHFMAARVVDILGLPWSLASYDPFGHWHL